MKTMRIKTIPIKTIPIKAIPIKAIQIKTIQIKNRQIKTLLAALAVAGLATACDRDSAQRDAYVPPEPAAVERSTTAPGTTDPSALSSIDQNGNAQRGQLSRPGNLTPPDYEESLQFNGTELTPASEGKLEELVESLDKQQPIKVIVSMDQQVYENNAGEQTATANQQADMNQESRAVYTSAFGQRVETVKQFMQDQGVEVTQWQFERMEEQNLAQQEDSHASVEEVQSVRLVIAASPEAGEVSAVTED